MTMRAVDALAGQAHEIVRGLTDLLVASGATRLRVQLRSDLYLALLWHYGGRWQAGLTITSPAGEVDVCPRHWPGLQGCIADPSTGEPSTAFAPPSLAPSVAPAVGDSESTPFWKGRC
jgi:hypothetical protein